jgi:signal transduction histidine kinase
VVSIADIVALRFTEMRLRESREELARQGALLVEAQRVGRIGHWRTPGATQKIEWSEEMFALTGIAKRPDRLVAIEELFSIIHPDDVNAYLELRREKYAKAESYEAELRLVRPDAELRWLKITAVASGDGMFGVAQDITELTTAKREIADLVASLERRVAERTQALRDAEQELVRVERLASLGALVSGVAHEANTPIGIALTAGTMIADNVSEIGRLRKERSLTAKGFDDLAEHMVEAVDLLVRNLRRAAELIATFKQVSADQTSEDRREFELKSYVIDIVRSLSPELRRSRHHVVVTGDEGIRMDSYPGGIAQLVTNLVTNALKHAFGSPDKIGRITLELRAAGHFAEIECLDDGDGMSELDLAKVFDPFVTTKRGSGGTGLGMTIVHNIVTQKLGGTVRVKSAPGAGFRVSIRIPLSVASR